MDRRGFLFGGGALALAACGRETGEPVQSAGRRQVVDLAGRTVSLPDEVNRVVLGEGRLVPALAVLEDPTARVVGMQGEFKILNPDAYAHYARALPKLDQIPHIGETSADSVSVEKILSLEPDLAVFGLEGHGVTPQSGEVLAVLEKAGVPVVFVDFQKDPFVSTPRSIALLGEALGRSDRAQAFTAYYDEQLERVRGPLEAARPEPPRVFLESRVGLADECCHTMVDTRIGAFVDAAGGRNIAKGMIPGTAGVVGLETVLDSRPDVYVGTAVGTLSGARGAQIVLGPGADEHRSKASLEAALSRAGVSQLPAVRQGRAHAIWHHFYNSPFNVAGLQAMARWLHPTLFAELAPEQTLAEFHRRFQPVGPGGVYWVSA